MLTQNEINFYIGNKNNIIKQDNRGKIQCKLYYDSINKKYVIERKTPKTTWKERTDNYDKAYFIYYNFLFNSIKTLENHIRSGKTLYQRIYKNLWGDIIN